MSNKDVDRAWELYNKDSLHGADDTPIYRLIRAVFISGYEAGEQDKTEMFVKVLKRSREMLDALGATEAVAALTGLLEGIKEDSDA